MSAPANAIADTLRTLHRIHRQLSDLKERLSRGPRLARAHQANLERAEAELAKIKAEAVALRTANDRKQLQLASGEEAVKKRRAQLMQAADNREYQALRDQIAADEMANSVLADEILEGMEEYDKLKKKVAEAEQLAQKARAEAERSRREIEVEQPRIHADIDRLEAELRRVEAGLPADFLPLYRRLVQTKGEDALGTVQDGFCTGCNQQIPLNAVNDLLLSKPITCKSCGRMLYLPENYAAR